MQPILFEMLIADTELLSEVEFSKSLWGLGTEEEWSYHNGPPGYIG
jgi:hypothetical protein